MERLISGIWNWQNALIEKPAACQVGDYYDASLLRGAGQQTNPRCIAVRSSRCKKWYYLIIRKRSNESAGKHALHSPRRVSLHTFPLICHRCDFAGASVARAMTLRFPNYRCNQRRPANRSVPITAPMTSTERTANYTRPVDRSPRYLVVLRYKGNASASGVLRRNSSAVGCSVNSTSSTWCSFSTSRT